jgi:hypothetical protein
VQIPTVDEFVDDIINESEEPQPPKSMLLIPDDSGRAELIQEGYCKLQIDYLKRYVNMWRQTSHMTSAPLRAYPKTILL